MRCVVCSLVLQSTFVIASISASLLLAPLCAGQSVSIGQSVQVSAVNGRLNHHEVVIAADLSNSGRLLACSMVIPAQPSTDLYRNVAYVSFDGGLTWSSSIEIAGDLWSADPSCAFGPDGGAFYAALVFDSVERKYKGKTVLHKSADGGKTWSVAFTFPEEGDREFLTIDALRGRIYLVQKYIGRSLAGAKSIPIIVYDSDDGGKSFQTRSVLSARSLFPLAGYPGGVLSDGTFVTSISDFATGGTEYTASGSGAPVGKLRVLMYNRNVNEDVSLSDVDDLHRCNMGLNGLPLSSVAVDSGTGEFRDRIYVAWPDSRSGRCEILFSTSSDQGRTWSRATRINDDRGRGGNSGPDDFQPVVAVNREGIVGVLWYDRRENRENLEWAPRFRASLDGGQTFLPSVGFKDAGMKFLKGDLVQLGARADGGGNFPIRGGGVIEATFGYYGPPSLLGGETAGLAADALGVFHALWVDNRTGIRQVWTASVTVDGTVARNGSKDLALLEDVSGEVAVLFSDVTLDKKRQVLTANAFIQNTSDSDLHVPLKLRILRLDSRIGLAEFRNADNGYMGPGAVFDFSSATGGPTLAPGKRSAGKQIIIHLDHLVHDLTAGDFDQLQRTLTLDTIVLGSHDVAPLNSVPR